MPRPEVMVREGATLLMSDLWKLIKHMIFFSHETMAKMYVSGVSASWVPLCCSESMCLLHVCVSSSWLKKSLPIKIYSYIISNFGVWHLPWSGPGWQLLLCVLTGMTGIYLYVQLGQDLQRDKCSITSQVSTLKSETLHTPLFSVATASMSVKTATSHWHIQAGMAWMVLVFGCNYVWSFASLKGTGTYSRFFSQFNLSFYRCEEHLKA